jgi:hypothetical protein
MLKIVSSSVSLNPRTALSEKESSVIKMEISNNTMAATEIMATLENAQLIDFKNSNSYLFTIRTPEKSA